MSLLWSRVAARTYYHGSDHEFEPGDLVRPQKETGVKNWAEQLRDRVGDAFDHDDDLGPHYTGEHVHHTDAPHKARDYGRHVYEVQPLTPVERDPEDDGVFLHDMGWTRNKGPAKVIRRVEKP